MRILLALTLLLSNSTLCETGHRSQSKSGNLGQRPELLVRTLTDADEAHTIIEASEKENSEWAAVSCAKEGCTYQRMIHGSVTEEVFIPAALKDKARPKSAGQAESHESEYPALNTVSEYEAALEKAKKEGRRYLMVKFGAPNHNCLSCLRFDQFMATPEMKKFLADKKVGIYTTDVGEFTNPDHSALAAKLGAQVANQSFHIPYVAVVDLSETPPRPKTLINGYFGGVSSERESARELKRIQRVIP